MSTTQQQLRSLIAQRRALPVPMMALSLRPMQPRSRTRGAVREVRPSEPSPPRQ